MRTDEAWNKIVFFAAADGRIAASTRTGGGWQRFPSVNCQDFEPDDAVVEWDMYFETPSPRTSNLEQLHAWPQPTWVAPIVNDGSGVFVLPDRLTIALADAAPAELTELATRWTERLTNEAAEGDEMTADDPLAVLQAVAQLARTAAGAGDRLYCWHSPY